MSPDAQDLGFVFLKCGGCYSESRQQVVTAYEHQVPVTYDDGQDYYEHEQEYFLRLSLCSKCNSLNLTVEDENEEGEEYLRVLWPTPPRKMTGLPDRVAKEYASADAVRTINTNAFAVLLGRVLDEVCLDRKAQGNSLSEKLRDLATKGEIPGRLADMGHQLRALRNIGAHANLGELTAAEVPILDELCRTILEYVYVAPTRIAHIEQRIQQLKQPRK